MFRLSFLALLFFSHPLLAVNQPVRTEARTMAESAVDPLIVEGAINKLHQIGIITDPQPWIDNVKPGKFIPTADLQPIVIAAANKFETVETVHQALEVLHKNRILSNVDKWTSDLIGKPKAASGVVGLLFIALSKHIN